ncbi:MAG: FUSC family protein [Candidatus Nanopelagicales bacterium]|nr:FUSC family protein [Candidatus Nanopelagicales bacterium]
MTKRSKAVETTRKVTFAVLLMVVIITVPVMVLIHFGWQAAGTAAMFGAMACLMVGVQAGWRASFIYVVPGMTIATACAAAFPGNAWWAALILGISAGFVAFSSRMGLNNALLIIPIALGFEFAQPPQIDVDLPAPVFVGLVVLGTTIFGSCVVYLVSRHNSAPKDLKRVSVKRSNYFALTLGPFVAIAAWVVVHFDLAHGGAWMILTILVIFQPFIQDGMKKAVSRTAGTLGGFLVAIIIAETTNSVTVYYLVGVLSMVLALTFMLIGRPYWQYAVALTMSIVMLEGATDLISTAETRLVATVAGAGASVFLMFLLRPLAVRSAREAGIEHY